jgi:polyisoprenyl-phosphate glycosyltransferase
MPVLDTFVSVVIPLHNCEEIVGRVVGEVGEILRDRYAYYEIVLIENGSSDRTLELCKQLVETAMRLRVIPLSRHMHQDIAITAGLEAAIGDYVVVLNPNWDPPTVIPEMIEHCRGGYDVVVGISDKDKERAWLYRTCRSSFYSTIARIVPVRLISGMTYLLAISREAVNGITSVQRRRRFLSVLIADIGYCVKTYPYARINRTGQPLSPSLLEAIREGTSLVVHNSNAPMRMVSLLGLVGSAASMMYACYVIFAYLFQTHVAPGWATISLITSFLFLVMFLMLLLIGEYMARLVEEMPGQPLYHVIHEVHSPMIGIEDERRNIYTESTGYTLQSAERGLGTRDHEHDHTQPNRTTSS